MISSGLKSAAVSARRRMEHEWWQYAQERHRAGAVRASLARADVIVRLSRRDLVWINVTTNPTAEWIARQITEAFPWNEGPLRATSSETGIVSMVPSSHADCAPWASGTSLPHRLHLGRMALLNG
jgi:hypothetical protein